MKNEITIGVDKIGEEHPVYFIADIAANHDGNLERAKSLISLAKESGANAVKFQHHDVKKYVSDYGFKSLGDKFSHQSKWKKTIFEVYKHKLTNYCINILNNDLYYKVIKITKYLIIIILII